MKSGDLVTAICHVMLKYDLLSMILVSVKLLSGSHVQLLSGDSKKGLHVNGGWLERIAAEVEQLLHL